MSGHIKAEFCAVRKELHYTSRHIICIASVCARLLKYHIILIIYPVIFIPDARVTRVFFQKHLIKVGQIFTTVGKAGYGNILPHSRSYPSEIPVVCGSIGFILFNAATVICKAVADEHYA